MRNVIWLVLLFLVAVVAATTLGSNDGIVSIYWSGWRTDLSLNLFVLIIVGSCLLVMAAVQALNSLVSLPRRAGEWRALRRERAAQAALRDAQAEYFGARYSRAHKAAQKAMALQQDSPELRADGLFTVLAHLLAASSLHRLQDKPRRDEVMQRLQQINPAGRGADEAARLLNAEWAIDDRDADRALALLADMPPGVARRTQAMRLKLQASRLARKPLDALHTARLLANHQAFSPVAAQSLLRSLAFEAIDATHDLQQLRRLWDQLDRAERSDPPVVLRCALRAVALGSASDGREWLRPVWDRLSALPRDERDQVALAAMEVMSGVGNDWLPRLESALQTHGHEPAVQAAVGTAFAERQLPGKARRLLEQAAGAPALPASARRRLWQRLARQARDDDDEARAQQCERAAATLD
jgi:HemY protein